MPEPLISGYAHAGEASLGSLPNGQLVSMDIGESGHLLEVLVVDTDVGEGNVDLLMAASIAFSLEDPFEKFAIHMPEELIAAIVDRLCALDETLASLRTAVEDAESEPAVC